MAAASVVHVLRNTVSNNTIGKVALNKKFRVLFCPGLGSAKRDIIANKIQQWANQQKVTIHDLNYRNYGQENNIWDINDWKADVIQELQSHRLNNNNSVENDDRLVQSTNTVIVCYSAASQAVLRALLSLQTLKNINVEVKQPAGILMISPGVGMNINSYVERVMPGSIDRLKAGKTLIHPSGDPTIKIKINLECLNDFVNNCPTKKANQQFSIKCPVRIIHGIHDKIVPYQNSVDLLDRIETSDKELYLINDGHFVRNQQIISYALDNLWIALQNQKN